MPTGPPAHFSTFRSTAAGPIKVTTFKGPKSGVTGKVWVWLPPEYNDPKYAKSGFPVVFLFTGNTGVNYNFWPDPRVVPTQSEDVRLTQEGKAHPFIMIMPILQLSTKQDTECSDRPGQPKMATWMGEDLVTLVKQNFRTMPSRDGWGMAGASSGAFCAVKLTLQYSDQFKAAASWGGYFYPLPETGPRWTQQELQDNSPLYMVKKSQPDVHLLLLAGDNPKYRADFERIDQFMAAIKPPTTAEKFIQKGGAHLTDDLKKLVPNILEFLTQNLTGPQPSS